MIPSSKVIKVAVVAGINDSLDATRGVGVHNSELLKAIDGINAKDIQIISNPQEADVTHYTKFHPFFVSLPFIKPSKKVVLTIHDLHPLIYPRHFPGGVKGNIRFMINKLLLKMYVDYIITISETSKKDICRFLGVNPKIVKVIYLGPKDAHHTVSDKKKLDEVKKKFNLPGKFVFYFGDINYNKNIPTLVESCQKANITLVLAGAQATEVEKMDLNHPESLHLKNLSFKNVIRPGFITDEEANLIMNLAVCTVQPSFYEGFGLSVIHAFASGCPVIASKTQALVEIGGDACVYFDPNNSNELAEKIDMFANNEKLRQMFIEKGSERVKMFSWKKTAEETLKVYE